MVLKTFHFVPGLSRTPLLFIPRYLTNIFPEHILQKENIENHKSENLEIPKPRFTNRSPAYCRTGTPIELNMRTSDSGPPNHRNLMQQIQKTVVFHYFFQETGRSHAYWAFPIAIGRSRLWIGRSQGDYSRRLSEETIRRSGAHDIFLEWYLNLVPELGT